MSTNTLNWSLTLQVSNLIVMGPPVYEEAQATCSDHVGGCGTHEEKMPLQQLPYATTEARTSKQVLPNLINQKN